MADNTNTNTATRKIAIAVYAEHCCMKGRVCLVPEEEHGDNWRESADLWVFEGTEEELREQCENPSPNASFFYHKCCRAVINYLS